MHFGPPPEKPNQPPPDPPAEDEEAPLTTLEQVMADPVLQWRAKRLSDNGMTPYQARALAVDRTVDVAWVVKVLLNRGCDPHTAFDIAS
jgi:hypothetical protein